MKPNKSEFLDTAELAEWLGVSTRSVERMRADDTGPPFTFVRGRVRYHREAAVDWERHERRRRRPPPVSRSDLSTTSEPSSKQGPEDCT